MKTIIILAIVIIGTAALPNPYVSKSASEQMGQRVAASLQQASPEAFTSLFPTLQEFHQIMDENATLYGSNLNEAKEEFAIRYINEIAPSVKQSFQDLLHEGNEKGIDWSTVTYERVEYNAPKYNLVTTPFVVIIKTKEKEYSINIEKAFVLRGEWKVSSEIKLM
jgi:hypothetical protein